MCPVISIYVVVLQIYIRRLCKLIFHFREYVSIIFKSYLFMMFSHLSLPRLRVIRRFPIHCAVMGGNLDLVKWLIDAHGCPISVRRSPQSGMLQSVQTSRSRTLMDLVMTGKPKVDILAYLVAKNLDVRDAKDPTLAAKTLQTVMSAGYRFEQDERGNTSSSLPLYTDCTDDSVTTIEDAVS